MSGDWEQWRSPALKGLTCDARARAREKGGGKETLALLVLKIPFSFSFKRPTRIGSVSQLYLLTVLPVQGKRVTFFFYLPHFLFSISLVIILTPTLTVMILISVQLKM